MGVLLCDILSVSTDMWVLAFVGVGVLSCLSRCDSLLLHARCRVLMYGAKGGADVTLSSEMIKHNPNMVSVLRVCEDA